MPLPRSSRLISLLPILFFALFLYGVREYGAIGGASDLALAATAGLVCLGIVAALIYHHYQRPRLCLWHHDPEDQH